MSKIEVSISDYHAEAKDCLFSEEQPNLYILKNIHFETSHLQHIILESQMEMIFLKVNQHHFSNSVKRESIFGSKLIHKS